MPTINILTETAAGKSVDENSANLINMYLAADQQEGKYQVTALPTPGATLFSAGSTTVRAMHSQHGVTYGIDGNTFFSIDSSGVRTTLGTLNTSSGWAKIRGIANELFIADRNNGYYYIIGNNTFGQITNATSGNVVQSTQITNGGMNYTSNTTASFSGGGGTGAAGTAIVSGGALTAIIITNGGSGYTSAPTITITDTVGSGATASCSIGPSGFPALIQDIDCQDEFGLVLIQNSQTWASSAISDLTTWPPLSFASTTGNQNYNVGILSSHREVWLFGTQTTEVWDNQGQINFTFGRNSSVYLEYGCAAVASIAKASNTIFFLAQNPSGGTVVMEMNGYAPTKISNPAIEYQISTYSVINDAIAMVYQQEGHEFYVITFPTAGTTFAYDITTGSWTQRQSLISSSQTRWLANCATYNYNNILVGDFSTGNIYKLDMTNNTENNVSITRTLITHPFYSTGNWMYVDKLQIDFDNSPGINLANWTLYVSRDGGRTFGAGKAATPVQDANGLYHVYWLRLGSAKAFVFKLQTNANMQTLILGAWANIRVASA